MRIGPIGPDRAGHLVVTDRHHPSRPRADDRQRLGIRLARGHAVGLGSGICGAILTRDLLGLATEIIGVQSTEAPSYALSFAAGRVVETNSANTRADGMATRQPDAAALAIIRQGAARVVTVSDDEVAGAIRAYWTDTHNLAEGAGAAPLAALLQEKDRHVGKRVGLVLCGGNIDLALFKSWVMA